MIPYHTVSSITAIYSDDVLPYSEQYYSYIFRWCLAVQWAVFQLYIQMMSLPYSEQYFSYIFRWCLTVQWAVFQLYIQMMPYRTVSSISAIYSDDALPYSSSITAIYSDDVLPYSEQYFRYIQMMPYRTVSSISAIYSDDVLPYSEQYYRYIFRWCLTV